MVLPKPYKESYVPMPKDKGTTVVHTLYVAEYGNPDSRAPTVVILHGGPGVPTEPLMATLCDLQTTRVVLFDQRGCGLSRPLGSLVANTTRHHIEDIERLRKSMNWGEQIGVVGGSWGASLAVMYAATYPKHVKWYVVRGFCAVDRVNIFAPTIPLQYPELWNTYTRLAHVTKFDKRHSTRKRSSTRASMTQRQCAMVYYNKLRARCANPPVTNNDPVMKYVDAWYNLEMFTLTANPKDTPKTTDPPLQRWISALFEAHFYTRRFFVKRGYYEHHAAARLRKHNVPGTFIHGRQDVICNVADSYDMYQWLTRGTKNSKTRLRIVEKAGHSYYDPRIRKAMKEEIIYFTKK